MKRQIVCMLVLCALLLCGCSAGFDNAEEYGKALQEKGYSVNIITDDYTSAPAEMTTIAFMLEMELFKENGDLTPEKMLLAGNEEGNEVIVVFYFDTPETAEQAEKVLENSADNGASAQESGETSVITPEKLLYTTSQSGNALRVCVKLD